MTTRIRRYSRFLFGQVRCDSGIRGKKWELYIALSRITHDLPVASSNALPQSYMISEIHWRPARILKNKTNMVSMVKTFSLKYGINSFLLRFRNKSLWEEPAKMLRMRIPQKFESANGCCLFCQTFREFVVRFCRKFELKSFRQTSRLSKRNQKLSRQKFAWKLLNTDWFEMWEGGVLVIP